MIIKYQVIITQKLFSGNILYSFAQCSISDAEKLENIRHQDLEKLLQDLGILSITFQTILGGWGRVCEQSFT